MNDKQRFVEAAGAALGDSLFTVCRFGRFVTADIGMDAWWSIERKSGAKQSFYLTWHRVTSDDGITFSQVIVARLRLRWGRLNQEPVKLAELLAAGSKAEPMSSPARREWVVRINQVPWWRKRLLCMLNRDKWRRARSYNLAACGLIDLGDHETAEVVRAHADRLWAEIYELPIADNERQS